MAYQPVERLEAMSEAKLLAYVRSRLLGQPSEPPIAWSQGDLPERFIVDAYALSTDVAFKGRLKLVIKRLLTGWKPALNDDLVYGSRLIHLVGRLGVEGEKISSPD